MDPENPVVKLCVAGMEHESKENFDEAAKSFLSAWSKSTDDLERCIAAHYVARHQNTPEEALSWNLRSLEYARAVGDEKVSGFLPSLYLNLGKSYEDLGDRDNAVLFYTRTQDVLGSLPDDPYGGMIRNAVRRALERVRTMAPESPE